tara:strand:- start:1335 stop:1595 length:261 start_codon:yes stop_codon:yes gene_type:complete
MKIQIDTKEKVIRLEDKANARELFDFLAKIFPNGEWEDFDLEAIAVINNWSNPIIFREPEPIPYTPYPHHPVITCSDNNTVFNLEY